MVGLVGWWEDVFYFGLMSSVTDVQSDNPSDCPVGLQSDGCEYRIVQDPGAVSEGFSLNAHGPQNAEVKIGHSGFAVLPVLAMLKTHFGSTCDQRGQIF